MQKLMLLGMTLFLMATSAWANSESVVALPTVASVEVVNINTANVEQLAEHLPGIGLKKAEAIVAYRESVGTFSKLEDIKNVKGLGDKLFERIKTKIQL